MKRNLFVTLFAALLAASAHAQFEPLDKYADREGFVYTYLDGQTLQGPNAPEVVRQLIPQATREKITSLRVLSCFDEAPLKKLRKDLRRLRKKNDFKALVDINEEDTNVTIDCLAKADGSKSILIITEIDNDYLTCVALCGKLTEDDLRAIIGPHQ